MILFDTETTGLIANSAIPLKDQPKIVELYALKLPDDCASLLKHHMEGDTPTLDEINHFIDTNSSEWESFFHVKKMEPDAFKTHGISLEMVANAPIFAEQYESLCAFFSGERTLMAHNLSYDRDMLEIELRRIGKACAFPWPWHHICTVEATENVEGFRLGLSALYEKLFSTTFPEAHRARNDVRAMASCVVMLAWQGVIRL